MAFRLAQSNPSDALRYGQVEANRLREKALPALGTVDSVAVKPTRFAGQATGIDAGLMGLFGRQARGEFDAADVQMLKDWKGRFDAGGLNPIVQQAQQQSQEVV